MKCAYLALALLSQASVTFAEDRAPQLIESSVHIKLVSIRTMGLIRFVEGVNEAYINPISQSHIANMLVQNLRNDPHLLVQPTPCSGLGAPGADLDGVEWTTAVASVISCAEKTIPPSELDDAINKALSATLTQLTPEGSLLLETSTYDRRLRSYRRYVDRDHVAAVGLSLERPSNGASQVVAVFPNSPASNAGIVAQDAVLAIDGKSVSAMSFEDIIAALRGAVGSEVKISYLRHSDAKQITIPIVRDIVKAAPSLGLPVGNDPEFGEDKGVIAIAIPRFIAHRTGKQIGSFLTTRLANQSSKPVRGIIIDLRGSVGGELSGIAEVADLFLDSGIIMSLQGRSVSNEKFIAHEGSIAADVPIFVLIDDHMATGATAFALALKDNGRAKLVGEPVTSEGLVMIMIAIDKGRFASIPQGRIVRANGAPLGPTVEPDIPREGATEKIEAALNMAKRGG